MSSDFFVSGRVIEIQHTKYSVEDVISVAKRITMQNINGEWNENIPALSDLKAYTEVMQ